ncbi:retrovirus-related pol polyprotein LINE-1 [Tanacetum coccineum]
MASGGSDRNAEDALSKLLQRGTVVEYHNEFEMLINRVTGIYEGSLKALYISELKPALQCALLRSNPTTLGEAFFRARITDARFEDENNQEADNNVGDQEDPNVNDKQEVKKVKKLPMKLQSKKNFKEALETTSKDLKKKMLDHDLQKIAVDQKKKHYKTKRTLKIDDEEFKKAKSETTTKIRKLAKVYGAWLPPWLAAHFVVYQPYVKNHWKEFMIIQRRIWKPRIKIALEVASEAIRETTIAADTVAKIEETGEFSTSESEEYGTKPKKRKCNYDGFKWCVQEASDFEELKQQLSTTSVLSLPDFNEVLVVEVDASANGIGASSLEEVLNWLFLGLMQLLAKERYKVAKKEAKIAVAQAKDKAYEDLYRKLDSKEGANDIYKIAKARERKRMDIGNVRYIKDEGEVRAALQRMERNKAVGPDQIPIEAWRCLEDERVKWLTCLFNKIFFGAKMSDEWRLSEVIPIYKNKDDMQACSNYRGIKLLSHTMKLWERVIERRLKRETRVSENQFGFMSGRSTTEAIHLLRSLMEKYRKRQRDLHMAFLDLEKAYDSVPRELLWRTLRDKGTPRRYLRVIKDMYEGVKTRVRTTMGSTEFFQVEVGLHQGSTISPYLFTLILDELSRGIQESIPWCMIFADDIVLIAESAEGLNNRIEKYDVLHQEVNIRIGDQILQPNESFRYLGLVIHRSGRIDEDVARRIGVGWMKWRAASGVMCDRRIPLKLKGKFYRVAIRPAMLYGSECCPITKAQANRVEVAELRMLRWTCGKTMVDMIPNGVFRAELDVDSIIDKMKEGRLRWFGHVKRRPETAPVRRVEAMLVEGSRRRGRPKLRWEDRLKQDMKKILLSEDMTSDRNAWRDRIRISG